jgi:hypothetical protein
MSIVIKGKKREAESIKTCVLYDPSDGHIVHTHQVVILPGARNVGDSEVESRAFAIAKKVGRDVSKVRALHISSKDYAENINYKVDVKSLRLTEIPWPASRRVR